MHTLKRAKADQKRNTPKPLQIEQVKLAALRPAPYNPRTMTEEARARLRRGIERFGLVDPIVARRRDGLVIGGHQRLQAASEIGLARVPVVYVDATDDEAAALNVLLNNPSAQGAWDLKKLSDIVSELDAHGFDATLTGFDEGELERLLTWAPANDREESENLDLTPPEKPKSERGQVYVLGRHRVMCGDSRVAGDVASLMGKVLANVLWTDPPYGVSYVGKTAAVLEIENDNADGLEALLSAVFAAIDPFMQPGCRFYVAGPAGRQRLTFHLAVIAAGWRFHQSLVWVKDVMVLGHSDYHFRHEEMLYGSKPGPGRVGHGRHAGTQWFGDHAQTSVFEVPKPKRSDQHPTTKPPQLIRMCLANSAHGGHIVLDPFGGSGSTLIAAEQQGVESRLMEIDPRYCDVIRRRYAALTNQPEFAP